MARSSSIALKLIIVITLCGGAIFAGALGFHYYRSRAILEEELEEKARNLALSLANRVDAELLSVSKIAETIAGALETCRPDEQEIARLVRRSLEQNPSISGSAVAFEPYAFSPSLKFYAPYHYRSGRGIEMTRLEKAYRHQPYLYWDWYQIPRELGTVEWSEPYFDEGASNVLMATVSAPFYSPGSRPRKVRGVVTADIRLEALTRLISSARILRTGYASLLSRNGMVVAHPNRPTVMNESFFSIAEARGDPALRDLGRKMTRGESGFVRYTNIAGMASWLYYVPIRSSGWTLCVVFPEHELYEKVDRLTGTMALIGLAGLFLLALAAWAIATSITLPLRSLARATASVASGNFDIALPAGLPNDEVGSLAASFGSMAESLKEYIRNLTETTAAKERIQGELNVATDIQASLLPRIFPPFPDRPEFDIFAAMDPAKEVGGDFFDFFFIDRQHLCFLIADVADKGVPAALYMMVVKTLLKSEGQRLGSPEQILSNVNGILAADNETSMFATVFLGVLDTGTGEIRFTNAGHNPPALLDSAGIRLIEVKPGIVLGPVSGVVYSGASLMMEPGATLFLYTDGVTEAKNPMERLYGESRLLEALQEQANDRLPDLVHAIRADVSRHADGAPQSDDVTMLAIRYQGGD
jgi:sigma-B regulation protein RsbU (phosphoserine phosphatase)